MRMLNFYGLYIKVAACNHTCQDCHCARDHAGLGMMIYPIQIKDVFRRKASRWVRRVDHNHLRLSRIIRSLRLFGMTKEARTLQIALQSLQEDCDVFSERSMSYWAKAAKAPLWQAPDGSVVEWLKKYDEGEDEHDGLEMYEEEDQEIEGRIMGWRHMLNTTAKPHPMRDESVSADRPKKTANNFKKFVSNAKMGVVRKKTSSKGSTSRAEEQLLDEKLEGPEEQASQEQSHKTLARPPSSLSTSSEEMDHSDGSLDITRERSLMPEPPPRAHRRANGDKAKTVAIGTQQDTEEQQDADEQHDKNKDTNDNVTKNKTRNKIKDSLNADMKEIVNVLGDKTGVETKEKAAKIPAKMSRKSSRIDVGMKKELDHPSAKRAKVAGATASSSD